jgi:hypothetical protein
MLGTQGEGCFLETCQHLTCNQIQCSLQAAAVSRLSQNGGEDMEGQPAQVSLLKAGCTVTEQMAVGGSVRSTLICVAAQWQDK